MPTNLTDTVLPTVVKMPRLLWSPLDHISLPPCEQPVASAPYLPSHAPFPILDRPTLKPTPVCSLPSAHPYSTRSTLARRFHSSRGWLLLPAVEPAANAPPMHAETQWRNLRRGCCLRRGGVTQGAAKREPPTALCAPTHQANLAVPVPGDPRPVHIQLEGPTISNRIQPPTDLQMPATGAVGLLPLMLERDENSCRQSGIGVITAIYGVRA